MANKFVDFDFLDSLIDESPPEDIPIITIARPPIIGNNPSTKKSSRKHPLKVISKSSEPLKIENNQQQVDRQDHQESANTRVSPRTRNSHLSPRAKRYLANPSTKINNILVKTKVPNVGKDENRVKFYKMSVQQREAYVALLKFKCIPGVITDASQLKLDDSKQYDASSGFFTTYETSAVRESRRENYIINELRKKLNWMSDVDYARQSIESNRKYQLKMAKLKEIHEKEKERHVLIEKALLAAKYKVLDASLDHSPIKAIESEVIATIEKGLSRQHLNNSNAVQMVYNLNVSESSPQVDEASDQSTNSVPNSYQVGSSYMERQHKAKTYGRVHGGSESSNKVKITPVIPVKYQHLFKSSITGDNHSNIKKPDGKYPNYLPYHNSKRDKRSGIDEGYAYQNVNNLNDISKRYTAGGVHHVQNALPQHDPDNDGDAYFLDDGMEGMEIDGESTVSQLVFTEWGEDPMFDSVDNLPESNFNMIPNNNYVPYDGDDDPQDSRDDENVWKDYYYEDHEGNLVLDLSNRFDAVDIPQYMANDSARNCVDIHNNREFYNDLDKYNSVSPQSPYRDFPDEEDDECSNEYEDGKQFDDDLLTSTEENEVLFYNNGRSLDKYDYALDVSDNHEMPLDTMGDESCLIIHNDSAGNENSKSLDANETIDTTISSIGTTSSPGTDIAVAADEGGHEYVDDFEESESEPNVVDCNMVGRTDDIIADTMTLVIDEAESAATKLQSQVRKSQSKKRVDAMKKEKAAVSVAGMTSAPKEELVNTDEAESAATKLQSQVRKNQSKKRVDAMKKKKAATKTTDLVVSNEVVNVVLSYDPSVVGDRNAGMELIKAAKLKQQIAATKLEKDAAKRASNNVPSLPKHSDTRSIPRKAPSITARGAKPAKIVKNNNIPTPTTTESNVVVATINERNYEAPAINVIPDDDLKRKKDQALARLKKKKMNNNVEIVPNECVEALCVHNVP